MRPDLNLLAIDERGAEVAGEGGEDKQAGGPASLCRREGRALRAPALHLSLSR